MKKPINPRFQELTELLFHSSAQNLDEQEYKMLFNENPVVNTKFIRKHLFLSGKNNSSEESWIYRFSVLLRIRNTYLKRDLKKKIHYLFNADDLATKESFCYRIYVSWVKAKFETKSTIEDEKIYFKELIGTCEDNFLIQLFGDLKGILFSCWNEVFQDFREMRVHHLSLINKIYKKDPTLIDFSLINNNVEKMLDAAIKSNKNFYTEAVCVLSFLSIPEYREFLSQNIDFFRPHLSRCLNIYFDSEDIHRKQFEIFKKIVEIDPKGIQIYFDTFAKLIYNGINYTDHKLGRLNRVLMFPKAFPEITMKHVLVKINSLCPKDVKYLVRMDPTLSQITSFL